MVFVLSSVDSMNPRTSMVVSRPREPDDILVTEDDIALARVRAMIPNNETPNNEAPDKEDTPKNESSYKD